MSKQYVGHLPGHDPLHQYLQHEILPQIGLNNYPAKFRVFRMGGSNEVYLYEEKHSHVQVIGKFFARNSNDNAQMPEKGQRMQQEFPQSASDARLRTSRIPARHRTSARL